MRRRHGTRTRGTAYLIASAAVFTLFVIDILVAKVQVMAGHMLPVHLGDVGQFLVLLVAVTLFVIGTLVREKAEARASGRDG